MAEKRAGGAQKFIAKNRAPRVQIEYDVELYGAEKKVQLPFVMGVMSDLSGNAGEAPPSLDDRAFLEIDADSFDDRMKGVAPRVRMNVPNTVTGEGNLDVDLTFERIEDFSPAALASKVEPLAALLKARTQLSNLMAYMDGKAGAEELILSLLKDPAALAALAGGTVAADDAAKDALASLAASAPAEAPPDTSTDDMLAALAKTAPVESAEADGTVDTLDALAAAAPAAAPQDDTVDKALDGLAAEAPVDAVAVAVDTAAETLSALAESAPEDSELVDTTDEALSALADKAPTEEVAEDTAAETLAELADAAPADAPQQDTQGRALEGLVRNPPLRMLRSRRTPQTPSRHLPMQRPRMNCSRTFMARP